MKNIFVLPTEKPNSGYVIGKCIKELSDVKVGEFRKIFYLLFSEEYFQPHEIYITDDEEIKEWFIVNGTNGYSPPMKYSVMFPENRFPNGHNKDILKLLPVILTTDKELIKDGIQAIEDTFLDWFIENPTCEFAQVGKVTKINYDFPRDVFYRYGVTIPNQGLESVIDKPKITEECGFPTEFTEDIRNTLIGHKTSIVPQVVPVFLGTEHEISIVPKSFESDQELKGLLFNERYGQVGSIAEITGIGSEAFESILPEGDILPVKEIAMTKQEVIKQAYGEHWEAVKDYVDENGYCAQWPGIRQAINKDFIEFKPWEKWRPKSLKGLETNNGWTKIESESDLPGDRDARYNLCHISKDGYLPNESFSILKSFWETGIITHYQPTIKIEKPLW